MSNQHADVPRIVVVGAGLAGLTCAYRLAQAGVHAQVLEARDDRAGGRCWTARGFAGGQVAEHGGELIDTRHTQLRALVAELGLDLDDLHADDDAEPILHLRGQRRDPDDVDAALAPVRQLLARERDRVGDYRHDHAGPAAREFDNLSVADWVAANVPGGGSSLAGAAIIGSITEEFGADPTELSAIALLQYYVERDDDADERWHVRGGNDLIVDRLVAGLADGTLRLGAPLEALRRTAGGGYELSVGGSPSTVAADIVVLAAPFTALRRVDLDGSGLSEGKRAAIEQLGMGTSAKVLLQFDRRLSAFGGWSGELQTDEPYRLTWDSSSSQPGAEGLLTIWSGGSTAAGYPAPDGAHGPAPESVVTESLDWLERHVPGIGAAHNGLAYLDVWGDDPWTHGSYAAFRPGQYTRFWGALADPEGGIHVAGEHTSTVSQGFLNGAVESGERAAAEVLATAGIEAASANGTGADAAG